MKQQQEEEYDAFADAKLIDSLKVIQERQQYFTAAALEHVAQQNLSDGGWIEETITIRWVPRMNNGFNPGAAES